MKLKIKFKLNGQSTLFHKYLAISFVIILLSFLILGFILMSVLTKYWTNNKMETMSKNTSSLASLCTRYIRLQDSIKQDYFFDESIALQDIMETIQAISVVRYFSSMPTEKSSLLIAMQYMLLKVNSLTMKLLKKLFLMTNIMTKPTSAEYSSKITISTVSRFISVISLSV